VNYNYYHGYRYFEKLKITPQYWFGHGLSYTTFALSNLHLSSQTIAADGAITVTVDVKNTGPVAGAQVVQAYVGYENTALVTGTPPSAAAGWGRPVKELKAFGRTKELAPGASETLTMTVKAADLVYWDVATQKYVVEKMVHQLSVAPSADPNDPNKLASTFTVQ
jgi:beta-glucosidase